MSLDLNDIIREWFMAPDGQSLSSAEVTALSAGGFWGLPFTFADYSADFDLQQSDNGKILVVDTTSGDVDLGVPDDADLTLPDGSHVLIYNIGGNSVLIDEATGSVSVAVSGGTTTVAQWEMALLFKKTTDVWYVAILA